MRRTAAIAGSLLITATMLTSCGGSDDGEPASAQRIDCEGRVLALTPVRIWCEDLTDEERDFICETKPDDRWGAVTATEWGGRRTLRGLHRIIDVIDEADESCDPNAWKRAAATGGPALPCRAIASLRLDKKSVSVWCEDLTDEERELICETKPDDRAQQIRHNTEWGETRGLTFNRIVRVMNVADEYCDPDVWKRAAETGGPKPPQTPSPSPRTVVGELTLTWSFDVKDGNYSVNKCNAYAGPVPASFDDSPYVGPGLPGSSQILVTTDKQDGWNRQFQPPGTILEIEIRGTDCRNPRCEIIGVDGEVAAEDQSKRKAVNCRYTIPNVEDLPPYEQP